MRKIQKDAEKQSVLFNLVHRSVLLYGRRSITYVQEPGNKRRPVSMDLHSFSHSIELPRSEVIDPWHDRNGNWRCAFVKSRLAQIADGR
jgi:hypothetical protein